MKKIGLFLFFIIYLNSCKYALNASSIDPAAETFNVETFQLRAPNAPPTLGQTFRDELIDKIRNESRLRFVDDKADLEFLGSITNFRVSAVAPREGERTEFNRLDVTVSVEYFNNLDEDEKDNWKNNFSYFFDFESGTNLLDIQDEAIETINEQLLEDIFNKAFTNW